MPSSAQQLAADYQLIKKLIDSYPNIRLLETEGDPPVRYDFEYTIKGYRAETDGTASPANRHSVRISLPFGYPHFSPTAKPLTPIFHPDIDPDAIRIADFWQKNKSLPELVIYIGQMICGTFYSDQQSFNQRAFDWYEERKSWMPFDILEPRDTDDEEANAESFNPERIADGEEQNENEDIHLDLSDLQSEEDDSIEFRLENESPALPREDETTDLTGLAGEDEDEQDTFFEFELEESTLESGSDQELNDWTAVGNEEFSLSFDLDEDEIGQSTAVQKDNSDPDPLLPKENLLSDLDFDISDLETETIGKTAASEPSSAAADEGDDLNFDFGISDDFLLTGDKQEDISPRSAPSEDQASLEIGGMEMDDASSMIIEDILQSVRLLIEEKKIFSAHRMLADISESAAVSAELEELSNSVNETVSEAQELNKKADRLKGKGDLEKAGLILDLLANMAVDYPDLQSARNHIRESLMEQKETEKAETKKAGGKKEKKAGQEQEAEQPSEKISPVRKEKKSRRAGGGKSFSGFSSRIPYKTIAAILVLGLLGTSAAVIYLRDMENLDNALASYKTGETLANNMDFKQAQQNLQKAKTGLDDILVFQSSEKKDLNNRIEAIISAQTFREGLQGKVQYEGHYISVPTAKANDKFTSFISIAREAEQHNRIEQAITFYSKTLDHIALSEFQDQQTDIEQKINTLRLEQALLQARTAEEKRSWQLAEETYQKALELSGSFSSPDEQHDIARRLASVSLQRELDESKRAFTASEWDRTISVLQQAERIIEGSPDIVTGNEKEEISRLLVNARLFQLLTSARKEYDALNWDQAITIYNRAIALLEENRTILDKEEVSDNIIKIKKTILMTRIAGTQKLANGAGKDGQLEQSLEHFKTIISMIEKSGLEDDAKLGIILDNARRQTADIEKELTVNRRKDWLLENYEEIFRTFYPSSKSSELSNPQVRFIKREGDILVFTMNCVERQQGRPFSLQLNYQYNLADDKWDLYGGDV